jgi:hypothetical protein
VLDDHVFSRSRSKISRRVFTNLHANFEILIPIKEMVFMVLVFVMAMMTMIAATSMHDSFAFVSGQQKEISSKSRHVSPLASARQTAAPTRSKLTHLLAVVPRNRLRMCGSENGRESGVRRISSSSLPSTPSTSTIGRRIRHKTASRKVSNKDYSPAKEVFTSIVMP